MSMAKVRLAISGRRAEFVARQHLRRTRVFAARSSPRARCRRYRRRRAVPCSGPARRSAAPHARLRRPARRDCGRTASGCSIASGNRWRPGSTRIRPRMECDCVPAACDSSSSLERHQPLGLAGVRDPDHAGAVAGQRHEYARTLRRYEIRSRYCGAAANETTLKVTAA